MYVIGVRAEAINCNQKSGGQPMRVTRKVSFCVVETRGVVSQRLGMLVELNVRAKFKATPPTQADTKITWIIA